MDGVNLSIHPFSIAEEIAYPSRHRTKDCSKIERQNIWVTLCLACQHFLYLFGHLHWRGSPVWYARVVKEKKKERRGKDDNREKGEMYIRGQMKTGDAEEKRWKSVWIGSAKCKWWPSCSSLWFVFSCPSARVLDEPAASPLPALLS